MFFTAVLLRAQNPARVKLAAPRLAFKLRPHVTLKQTEPSAHLTNQTLDLIKKLRDNEYDTEYCQEEYKKVSESMKEHAIHRNEQKSGKTGTKLSNVELRKTLRMWTPK